MRKPNSQTVGFTLMEILIALFIFTIISMILTGALRNVLNIEARAAMSADRLRNLEMALLVLSRDIEQTLDRPVRNASGKDDPSFIGTPTSATFTHSGFANPPGSTLQRVRYYCADHALWRMTWPVLDVSSETKPATRKLLGNVSACQFQYYDKNKLTQDNWPYAGNNAEPLPRAVRILLAIPNWGSLSQLYLIVAEASKSPAVNVNPNNPVQGRANAPS